MAHDVGAGSYIRFGSILGSSPSAGAQFRVNSWGWGGVKRDDPADTTHLLSTAKEFIASEVYDPGELSPTVQYDPSINFTSLLSSAGTAQVCHFIFANGGTNVAGYSAFAYLQSVDIDGVERDGLMTATLNIKLSGALGTSAA